MNKDFNNIPGIKKSQSYTKKLLLRNKPSEFQNLCHGRILVWLDCVIKIFVSSKDGIPPLATSKDHTSQKSLVKIIAYIPKPTK